MSTLAYNVIMAPRLRFWRWHFWRDPKWQRSSLFSAATWLAATLVVYDLVEQLGHGWLVNVMVSLAFDFVAWVVGKFLIWRERQIDCPTSASRNTVVWLLFFGINLCLGWLVWTQGGFGTVQSRGILAVYGVLINPVRFRLNNELVFGDQSLRSCFTWLLRRIKTKTA